MYATLTALPAIVSRQVAVDREAFTGDLRTDRIRNQAFALVLRLSACVKKRRPSRRDCCRTSGPRSAGASPRDARRGADRERVRPADTTDDLFEEQRVILRPERRLPREVLEQLVA